jgi:hypothetical protein
MEMTITTSPLTRAPGTIDLYYGHARDDPAALWVHVVDDFEAERAVRGLADSAALPIRRYGHGRHSDFHLQRPTAAPTTTKATTR